jgi:hypothetical protein
MTPTSHAPGTAEKIATLRQRAELGLPLFHPHDRIDYSGCKIVLQTTRDRRAGRVGGVVHKRVKMSGGRKMLCE